MSVTFNKTTQDQVYHFSIGAAGAATAVFQSGGGSGSPTFATEIIITNYGSGLVNFRMDGATATSIDRVVMPGERLQLVRSADHVTLFSTAGSSVEVCFSV
jgi:hypothetical protein